MSEPSFSLSLSLILPLIQAFGPWKEKETGRDKDVEMEKSELNQKSKCWMKEVEGKQSVGSEKPEPPSCWPDKCLRLLPWFQGGHNYMLHWLSERMRWGGLHLVLHQWEIGEARAMTKSAAQPVLFQTCACVSVCVFTGWVMVSHWKL